MTFYRLGNINNNKYCTVLRTYFLVTLCRNFSNWNKEKVLSSSRSLKSDQRKKKDDVPITPDSVTLRCVCVSACVCYLPVIIMCSLFLLKHNVRVREQGEWRLWWGSWCLVRSGRQDSQKTFPFRALSNRGQCCNNIFPRDMSPFSSQSSHL